MGQPLQGEHYCVEHQGNHSHYASHNCVVCNWIKLCEAKDAEIAKLKEIPMKYRRMEFNAQLQKELSEAQAQIAMQAEALKAVIAVADRATQEFDAAKQALSATSETVAAWRAKETEPYKREVAMLRNWFLKDNNCECETCWSCSGKGAAILSSTQATALAYEREVVSKARIAALEDAIGFAGDYSDRHGNIYSSDYLSLLRGLIEQERANKGEVK